MPQIARRAMMASPLLLVLPRAAEAHAILRRSEPAAGATVPPGPLRIHILFNSRIDHERSQILIAPARRGGGGTADEVRVELEPNLPATEMAGTTQPLAPGNWRFRWQVLALDGHITRGDVLFTVAG
jgi:methionine-rich copper-binding protein CopC